MSSRTPPTKTTKTTKSRKAAERQRRAAELAAERARAERRRRLRIAVASIAAVALVLTGLVVASVAGLGDGDDDPAAASTSSAAAAVKAATSVPASALDAVGAGTSQTPPTRVPDATAISQDGKPQVLYVGAEYCPFCAAQRWPVVVAISRFGTWKGLGGSESASDDVYPRTKTLTFHGASYTSDYLAFTGVETSTNQKVNGSYEKLDELTGEDAETFTTYARPPFISGPAGSIPFLSLGGEFVLGGSQFIPDVLAGQSRTDIASALDDPQSDTARAVNGSANVLTAALCELTDGQPHNVCMSTGVMTAAKKLDAGS
jgi:hypothetical protein